ncbi:DUF502 domain-containing protein [Halorubrum tibetense]|uniref:DUF502 domain-containing protein n=1 Tax=Halorubrum tibetense TaxID=175631 RepID=A0ABD5SFX3_9EURY
MPSESTTNRQWLRRAFLTGVAVVVPFVITVFVLAIAFNAVYDYLDWFSSVLATVSPQVVVPVVGRIERELLIELATPVVFVTAIVFIGAAVDSTRYGERAVDYVDYVIEAVPGIGSVYEGFRQMSDVMLESDEANFREVVLVEFPTEGVYTVAFVTSETPDAVTAPSGEESMRTLFMPMAPNPVMGGHVVFVPEDRIVDVDLTVEQGIRALVTSGVALEEAVDGAEGLSREKLRQLSVTGQVDERFDPPRVGNEAEQGSDGAEPGSAGSGPENGTETESDEGAGNGGQPLGTGFDPGGDGDDNTETDRSRNGGS